MEGVSSTTATFDGSLLQVLIDFLELDKHPQLGKANREGFSFVGFCVAHFYFSFRCEFQVPSRDGRFEESTTKEEEGTATARGTETG